MPEGSNKVKASFKAKLVLSMGSACFCMVLVEVFLRLFMPYSLGATGHWAAPNTEKYGWGYNPGAKVRILDPDSGELHTYQMNRQGWQDRDHSFAKPKGVFRVLVIGDSNFWCDRAPRLNFSAGFRRVAPERGVSRRGH